MQAYPKIQNLWKRDQQTKLLIPGEFSCWQFEAIKEWYITEKVDGTNARVIITEDLDDTFEPQKVSIKDKQSRGVPPAPLEQYLRNHFNEGIDLNAFVKDHVLPLDSITLYGEGYGGKIQASGPNYCAQERFIIFDAKLGPMWLPYNKIIDIAHDVQLPFVPVAGPMSLGEIINYVKSAPISLVSKIVTPMEGIVAMPSLEDVQCFEDGTPIKFKLKYRDLAKL